MSRVARPSARKGAAEPESRPLRLWELLFRPRLMLGVLLIAGGIAIAPFLPVWWDQLRNQEEYRITPSDIVVTPPNEWVPPQLLQEVLAEFPPRMSLLDDSLLTDIAVAFARNPWIESVEQVRKTREGIEVDLVYRRPVLFVKTELGFYPVDAAGILLPPTDFSEEDTAKLPVFESAGASPSGGAGHVWSDPAVLAAVSLAECLVPEGDASLYWERFELVSIHAAAGSENATPEESFLLRTRGGTEILWGRSPRQEFSPLEPTTEQKLARLVQYCEQYGDFQSPSGPYHIDIRHFEHISRKPLEPSYR